MVYAVVGGKKLSIVVGKYDDAKTLSRSTDKGGVSGRSQDLNDVLRKRGGGKYRRDAFWICKVTKADHNATVVDTVKYQEICTKWCLNEK